VRTVFPCLTISNVTTTVPLLGAAAEPAAASAALSEVVTKRTRSLIARYYAHHLSQQLPLLNTNRDILLVDQRGTGRSKPHKADVAQYGTRMTMDDLDAVRAALDYRQLDVIGRPYGATAAQVYVKLHPASVHTLILSGGTAIDVPFFTRYAVNAQRALGQLAKFCASQPGCRKAFPDCERQFGELVKAWNAHPVHGMTGDEFASVVHAMLLNLDKAVSIPLVVSRAAAGDYAPLKHAGSGDLPFTIGLMSSIWCNEPWAGLAATGP
jgi:pimeloyl-ACP methyl ester carboxylesterase